MAVGVHYKGGPVKVWVDHAQFGKSITRDENNATATGDGAATKFGAQYAMGAITLGVQQEMDGGALGKFKNSKADTTFLTLGYKMGMTNVALSYGMRADAGDKSKPVADQKDGHSSWAVGAVHAIAKSTALYAGYGSTKGNAAGAKEDTALAIGLNHKF